jgi:putative oxygen-independent coproporphyrinogen III oxidase
VISIYIHWPFCLSKCPYCDFNSHVANTFDYQLWKSAYVKEINHFSSHIKGQKIRSIFFGGGTPSLMSADLVTCVINEIGLLGVIDVSTEISLEANPNSVEAEKFAQFAKAGINRISIGVQSLSDDTLKFLGRKHSAGEAIRAISIAKQCFENVSCDIIYACHGQSLTSWSSELAKIIDFKLNHLSLYQLTIEEHTKFHTLVKLGRLPLVASDFAVELYEYTNACLSNSGYEQYEISNYSFGENYRCKHNLNYWHYESYIGIGPGAHSRVISESSALAIEMHKSPQIWLQHVSNNGHGIASQYRLATQESITEMLFMGLRVNCGVCINKLEQMSQKSLKENLKSPDFQFLVDEGFLFIANERIVLTNKGMLLHSEMTSQLIEIFA